MKFHVTWIESGTNERKTEKADSAELAFRLPYSCAYPPKEGTIQVYTLK